MNKTKWRLDRGGIIDIEILVDGENCNNLTQSERKYPVKGRTKGQEYDNILYENEYDNINFPDDNPTGTGHTETKGVGSANFIIPVSVVAALLTLGFIIFAIYCCSQAKQKEDQMKVDENPVYGDGNYDCGDKNYLKDTNNYYDR